MQDLSKRYFISHATPDKPFALELKAALQDDAWVDLHEIEIGDLLLKQISSGIEGASDFVLLWSAHSAKSRWVEYELNMAFIRHLQDATSMGIRVVALDDTPAPLHLQPLLQFRPERDPDGSLLPASPEQVASRLLREPARSTTTRKRFINRHAEISVLEDSLYDRSTAAVWVHGIPGSGKRSLAREGLNRLSVGSGTVQAIRITAGTAAPELNLLLAQALGTPPAGEIDHEKIVEHNSEAIREFYQAGGLLIFEDAEHWLADSGELGYTAASILKAVASAQSDHTNSLMAFTSRRRAEVSPDLGSAVKFLALRGLSPAHCLPVLRAHSTAEVGDAELLEVAREVGGHPLALEVVASQLPMPLRELRDQRTTIATDLIVPDRISGNVWSLLEALSLVDGPVSGADLAEFLRLDADEFQQTVAEATAFSLVESSDFGSLILHPLLRDYFLRAYRKNPGHAKSTEKLAEICERRLSKTKREDPEYVQTLIATVRTLGLAGRFERATSLYRGLTGTLYQTAEQLYQERRYTEALPYIEEALTGDMDVDIDVLRLKVKTLAYAKQMSEARSIADQLVMRFPKTASVVRDRGRVEFIARDWNTALAYFRKAVPLRRNPSQIWVDIAQCHVRLEQWEEAAVAAKNAIDLDGGTPWALSLRSQALERLGDFKGALEVISMAVKREPLNPIYRHRLGRIAYQTGDRVLALSEFRRSLELDPNQPDTWISLANVLLDDQQLDEARSALSQAEKLHGGHEAVVENVRARIALIQGDLDEAQAHSDLALRLRRDPQNLLLSIRVAITLAESGRLSHGQARAIARSHAHELDGLGKLALVADLAAQNGQYFE